MKKSFLMYHRGLSAEQSVKVTQAQLAEADYWCASNACDKNSPLGQGYLRSLVDRGYMAWGSTPDADINQPVAA